MNRLLYKHSTNNVRKFKEQLLQWSQQFNEVVWLDSNNPNTNQSKFNLSDFDAVLAIDVHTSITSDSFEELTSYQQKTRDYIFGYLGYDLKNNIEQLSSDNIDNIGFPELFFFQPKRIILLKKGEISFLYLNKIDIQKDIEAIEAVERIKKTNHHSKLDIKPRIDKSDYLEKVNQALTHIHRGDIYEINLCQEFYAENSNINPLITYTKLNQISTTPFASFLKLDDKFLLSASPERFLKRKGTKVISQPIKGTIKRGESLFDDIELKKNLANDSKEQSENVMIVDLVRNDLSKLANKGSVEVAELCKVYTFKQVHQLISTIVAEIKKEINSVEVIKSMFPMGSMTGAPKVSAMKIIEILEETKRGIYSGAIGYFAPNHDFDFNVVIRSIAYNKSNQYVSYTVGSAITAKSNPETEYEECLLKAKAMREVLS